MEYFNQNNLIKYLDEVISFRFIFEYLLQENSHIF